MADSATAFSSKALRDAASLLFGRINDRAAEAGSTRSVSNRRAALVGRFVSSSAWPMVVSTHGCLSMGQSIHRTAITPTVVISACGTRKTRPVNDGSSKTGSSHWSARFMCISSRNTCGANLVSGLVMKCPTKSQSNERHRTKGTLMLLTQATPLVEETSLWESGLVAAVIAAVVALVGFWLTVRATRLDRQRQLFAEAFGAVTEYREYPFIVRRRTSDTDRGDITTELSTIQASLNKYVALLRVESSEVGVHYQNLVGQTRRIAGTEIAAGWDMPIRNKGEEMHVQDVDLSPLVEFDEAFIAAVKRHLNAIPSWVPGQTKAPSKIEKGSRAIQSGRPTGS